MTASTFEISTKALAQLVKPIVPLAGKDDMLPLLRCVRFQASGKYLTAATTDRFRVGIARVELDTPPPANLDIKIGLDELKQLLAVFKSDARIERTVTITVVDENKIKVEQAFGFGFVDASMGFPLVQGDYPRLTHLFKRENLSEPVTSVGLNGAYLADFRHAAREGEPLIVRSGNERKPLIITAGEHFIGALMPVRAGIEDGSDAAMDSWADVLAEKPEAKPAKKTAAKKKTDAAA